MFVPGPDASALEESVNRRRIRQIYHASRIDSLSSIFVNGGLLSRATMDSMGVTYEMNSWGTYEKEEEMAEYICCSLIPPWGMANQDPDSKVVLALNPRLIWRQGTVFAPEWSSDNRVVVSELKTRYTIQAFDSLFDNPTGNWPSPYSVEIVVPDKIPIIEFLPRMYFHSKESRDDAREKCGHLPHGEDSNVQDLIRFTVDRRKFRGSG